MIPEPGGTGTVPAQQLALLVEAVSDYAIFMLDPQGHVMTWNRGARRIKGYEAADIIGQHFSRFYTDEDRLREHPQYELEVATREGRFEEEGWRLRKDGSRFWANVVITALREESGKLIGFGKVTRDLTARRLGEEQLRASAAELQLANQELRQFRLLVANVEDYAIFMLDPGGHVATWNLGAEKLKGYTPDDAIGRHFSAFYTSEDRLRSRPARALEAAARDGHFETDGWRVRKDGSRFWANVTLTAIRDEHGVLVGYAKITRDLTERKAADDALAETQARLIRANQELQHLAAAAAHDLAAPIQTISGFAELLKTRAGSALEGDPERFLDNILSSARHMQQLVRELSDYATAVEGTTVPEPTPADVAAATAVQSLQAAIAETAAQIELAVSDDAIVMADPLSLERVFQNLIANAVKFAASERSRVEIGAERQGDRWRFQVTDNGPGIDEDDRQVIFEPFRHAKQTRDPGSGLGLAICRKIVERYDGEIAVEPNPDGVGARFWFTLPAARG